MNTHRRRIRACLLAATLLLPGMAPPAIAKDLDAAIARLDALLAPPPCADRGSRGEIVVCGRRSADPERYRLPLRADGFDPDGKVESVSRERNRLMEGGGGTGSCSATGAGGWTGCFIQQVRRSQQQHGFH